MEILLPVLQTIIALGIFNVWLLRHGKATNWRGGSAVTMQEEFAVYGLPGWSMPVVGFLKVACAVLLIAGIWIPDLARPGAIVLAVLMLGAITMHFKVKDPPVKSLPAFAMLVLCAAVAIL